MPKRHCELASFAPLQGHLKSVFLLMSGAQGGKMSKLGLGQDFPGGSDGKASVYNVRDLGSIPGLGRFLEKEMATHSSTLALKISWTEELGAGCSPWGRKESGMTERLHFHFLYGSFSANK